MSDRYYSTEELMDPDFEPILKRTFGLEGGITTDRGGLTNKGVTQTLFNSYNKQKKRPTKSVRDISDDEAAEVYYDEFYNRPKINQLPSGVKDIIFDFGVQSSPKRAIETLQSVVGSKSDGLIGPNTLKAVDSYIENNGEKKLMKNVMDKREEFIKTTPAYQDTPKGLMNRLNIFRKEFQLNMNNLVGVKEAYADEVEQDTFTTEELMGAAQAPEGQRPSKAPIGTIFTTEQLMAEEDFREDLTATEKFLTHPIFDFLNRADKEPKEKLMPQIKQSFKDGAIAAEVSQVKHLFLQGKISAEEAKKFHEAQQEVPISDDDNYITTTLKSLSNMIPAMLSGIEEGVRAGALAGGSALAGGITAPAAPLMFAAGQKVGSFSYWYRQGSGDLYYDMYEKGIPDDIAKPTAYIGGAMYAAIEFAEVDKFIPGGKKFVKKAVGDTMRKVVSKVVLKIGRNALINSGEEFAQTAITESAQLIASELAGQDNDLKQSVNDILAKSTDSFAQSIGPMALLGLPNATMNMAHIAMTDGERKMKQEGISLAVKKAVSEIKAEMGETQVMNEADIESVTPKLATDESGQPIEIGELPVKSKPVKASIAQQFNDANDTKLLSYLAQYMPAKDVASMTGQERLDAGNMSADELRDLAYEKNSKTKEGSVKIAEDYITEEQSAPKDAEVKPILDENEAYQKRLKAMLPFSNQHPEYDIPLHPAEEGKAMAAALEAKNPGRIYSMEEQRALEKIKPLLTGRSSMGSDISLVSKLKPEFLKGLNVTSAVAHEIFKKAINGEVLTKKDQKLVDGLLSKYIQLDRNTTNKAVKSESELSKLKEIFPEITDEEIARQEKELENEWDDDKLQIAIKKYLAKQAGDKKSETGDVAKAEADTKPAGEEKLIEDVKQEPKQDKKIQLELQAPEKKELFQEDGELFNVKDFIKDIGDAMGKAGSVNPEVTAKQAEARRRIAQKHLPLLIAEAKRVGNTLQKYLEDLGQFTADQIKFLVDYANDKKLIKKQETIINKQIVNKLRQSIEEGETRFIRSSEITILKNKAKAIKQGIRKGRILTKQEITENQKSLRQLTRDLKMEPKDLKKVLGRILDATNEQKLISAINEIQDKAIQYAESNEKNKIKEDIKKDLSQTKDIKKRSKAVGRYDYESNKAFSIIRSYQKLSKTEAMEALSLYPAENLTEQDLIKRRILSLQANGMEASLSLFKKVKSDIRRMKFEGRMAKNEQDFMDRIEYKEQKQEIFDEINRMKPEDVISWKTRAFNFYRKGLSNYQSLLYSMAGKKIGDKYDLQAAELDYTTKAAIKTREVSKESAKILGIKDREFLNFLKDSSEKKHELYENKEGGNKYNLSILDIVDMYNGIKNEHTMERVYDVYGKDQIDSLIDLLSDEQKSMADYWQEVAQENKDTYNKYLIDTTGRDMGLVQNYWMRTSELDVDITNDLITQSNIPSAVKARSGGNVIPLFKNAYSKLMKNINNAQYIESMNDSYIESKRMFSDRKVKNMIENKYGADIYNNLMKKIDMLSLHGTQQDADFMEGLFGQAVNGWVVAKIALSESVFIKQLISTGNYMEDMPAVEWTKGFAQGLKNPKQTFDFMWNNSQYVRERFARGYSEALENALRETSKLNDFRGDIFQFVSSFARAGDITAIIYGGYPLVQKQLAEGKTMEEAMKVFELATVKAQQSGLVSSRSDFQNSKNGFARPFLAFKNTVSQYARKMVDAQVLYNNGDITGKQYAKIMSIYGFIQPALFGLVGQVVGSNLYEILGNLFRGDDDDDVDFTTDLMKSMILAVITNPINAIPFFRDVVEQGARKVLDMDSYDPFNMGIIDDMRSSFQQLKKKDKDALDYFEIMGGILEPTLGLPVKSTVRKTEKFLGVRRFNHVSRSHANFVERFSDVKRIRKEYRDAISEGDIEKAKKIKNKNGNYLNIYEGMNEYYKRIAKLKKRLNLINDKKIKSTQDKELIKKIRDAITEISKKAIIFYENN